MDFKDVFFMYGQDVIYCCLYGRDLLYMIFIRRFIVVNFNVSSYAHAKLSKYV
jgi:hypothetical protein